jgi:hypothetical protein
MLKNSPHEYAIFASAQLLRKWREQRPSNYSNVKREVRRVYQTAVDLLLI